MCRLYLRCLITASWMLLWLTDWPFFSVCFPFLLTHSGQDNLCSPSDILQLNLSVKRTVETLLSLGTDSEESSLVSLSVQLWGFVVFYCTLMLTLCMFYRWVFFLWWRISGAASSLRHSSAWEQILGFAKTVSMKCFVSRGWDRGDKYDVQTHWCTHTTIHDPIPICICCVTLSRWNAFQGRRCCLWARARAEVRTCAARWGLLTTGMVKTAVSVCASVPPSV